MIDLWKKHFNENLSYSIDCLVVGLSLSSEKERIGFATLPLELLELYSVSTERLLTIAQSKFGNICKEAVMDNLVAMFYKFCSKEIVPLLFLPDHNERAILDLELTTALLKVKWPENNMISIILHAK